MRTQLNVSHTIAIAKVVVIVVDTPPAVIPSTYDFSNA